MLRFVKEKTENGQKEKNNTTTHILGHVSSVSIFQLVRSPC